MSREFASLRQQAEILKKVSVRKQAGGSLIAVSKGVKFSISSGYGMRYHALRGAIARNSMRSQAVVLSDNEIKRALKTAAEYGSEDPTYSRAIQEFVDAESNFVDPLESNLLLVPDESEAPLRPASRETQGAPAAEIECVMGPMRENG